MSRGPEAEQLEFERAHRRRRWRLALALAILVGVPITWFVVKEAKIASARRAALLSPDQQAELTALLDRREALARDHVTRWNQALQPAALAALTWGTAECPLKLVLPTKAAAAEYSKFATHSPSFGSWTLCILRPDADAKSKSCEREYAIEPEIARLRGLLAGDDAHTWDLEKAKAAPPREEPAAVLIVAGSEVRPTVHSPALGKVSFLPGTLSGRGFLFDPDQGRWICGGDVSVRNSKNVDIEVSQFGEAPEAQQSTAEYETKQALERDLELHLRFAVQVALRQLD